MSNEEENSNTDDNYSDEVIIEHLQEEEKPKAIKAAEELQKEERESEQLNVDPEQVLEEEGKRQPQSLEE
jgi:phosphosulfolactate phosphohydrolase-like enzyme